MSDPCTLSLGLALVLALACGGPPAAPIEVPSAPAEAFELGRFEALIEPGSETPVSVGLFEHGELPATTAHEGDPVGTFFRTDEMGAVWDVRRAGPDDAAGDRVTVIGSAGACTTEVARALDVRAYRHDRAITATLRFVAPCDGAGEAIVLVRGVHDVEHRALTEAMRRPLTNAVAHLLSPDVIVGAASRPTWLPLLTPDAMLLFVDGATYFVRDERVVGVDGGGVAPYAEARVLGRTILFIRASTGQRAVVLEELD